MRTAHASRQQAEEVALELHRRQERSPRAIALVGELLAYVWSASVLIEPEDRKAAEAVRESLWTAIEGGREISAAQEREIRTRFGLPTGGAQ